MLQPDESTLICTLGGQPQIVTFALDSLLARGEAVREVVALHLAAPDGRVTQALGKLAREFAGNQYRGQPCRFRHVVIRGHKQALAEIQTDAAAEATRQMVHQLIIELKQAGRTLHLCLAGGPRLMGLMALSAAMLHCGHQDKVWHLFTEPEFQDRADEGTLMHDADGRHVRLIQVPMVPWGAYIPALQALGQTPAELMQAQTAWLDETDRKRCQEVWENLTERQREVLRAFAAGGTPQEVAAGLHIVLKTVHSHKTVILDHCRLAWGFAEDSRLGYHFLRERFAPFFETLA
jgi:CRISPR-associated protein Csx14